MGILLIPILHRTDNGAPLKQSIFRLTVPHGASSCVETGQTRIGPAGMIQVICARESIREQKIHYGSRENCIIFGISLIFGKDKENKFKLIDTVSEQWQYHTVESIEEKWPTILPNDWLEQLVQQQAILLQG